MVLRHFELPLVDDPRGKIFGGRRRRRSIEPPLDVFFMAVYLLFAFQPQRHLRKLVFEVGGTIGVFGKVDVETLGVLCVVVVRRTEEFDVHNIMAEGVKFGEIKVVPNAEFDEDRFVVVKALERVS